MTGTSISLTYTDQPNGSQITQERLAGGGVAFVIHPRGWLLGHHSFWTWFRWRLRWTIVLSILTCLVMSLLRLWAGISPWDARVLLTMLGVACIVGMVISFLDDWVEKSRWARIEVTPVEVRITKNLQRWSRRRTIPRAKITAVQYWMGATRLRQKGRIFDLANVSCCGEGDLKWLAGRLRQALQLERQ